MPWYLAPRILYFLISLGTLFSTPALRADDVATLKSEAQILADSERALRMLLPAIEALKKPSTPDEIHPLGIRLARQGISAATPQLLRETELAFRAQTEPASQRALAELIVKCAKKLQAYIVDYPSLGIDAVDFVAVQYPLRLEDAVVALDQAVLTLIQALRLGVPVGESGFRNLHPTSAVWTAALGILEPSDLVRRRIGLRILGNLRRLGLSSTEVHREIVEFADNRRGNFALQRAAFLEDVGRRLLLAPVGAADLRAILTEAIHYTSNETIVEVALSGILSLSPSDEELGWLTIGILKRVPKKFESAQITLLEGLSELRPKLPPEALPEILETIAVLAIKSNALALSAQKALARLAPDNSITREILVSILADNPSAEHRRRAAEFLAETLGLPGGADEKRLDEIRRSVSFQLALERALRAADPKGRLWVLNTLGPAIEAAQLVKEIEAGDPDEGYAALDLLFRRNVLPPAIRRAEKFKPLIERAITDGDTALRVSAVRSIAAHANREEWARSLLRVRLHREIDAQVRTELIPALLGAPLTPEDVLTLLKLPAHETTAYRVEIVKALEASGQDVFPLLGADPANPGLRRETLKLLAKRGKKGASYLIAGLKDSDDLIRFSSLVAIRSMGGGASILFPEMIELLHHRELRIAFMAYRTFESLGRAGTPGVVAALGSPHRDLRAAALERLVDKNELPADFDARRLAELAASAMKSPLPRLRATLISKLCSPRAREAWAADAIRHGVGDPDPQVRIAAVRAMKKLTPTPAEIRNIAALLFDENYDLGEAAEATLIAYGSVAFPAVDAVKNRDPGFTSRIARVLGAMGTAAVPALLEMIAVGEDGNFAAEKALGQSGPEIEKFIPELEAEIQKPRPLFLQAGIRALEKFGKTFEKFPGVVTRSARRWDRQITGKAYAALNALDQAGQSGLVPLMKALGSPSLDIRRAAGMALVGHFVSFGADLPRPDTVDWAKLRPRAPKEILLRALGDADRRVSVAAGLVLSAMGFGESEPMLRRWIAQGEEPHGAMLSFEASIALARLSYAQSPAGVLTLLEAAQPKRVRGGAALYLAELGPRARFAIPALLRMAQEEDGNLRGQAITAIGKCGEVTPEVRATVSKALSDRSHFVIASAVRAATELEMRDDATAEALVALTEIGDADIDETLAKQLTRHHFPAATVGAVLEKSIGTKNFYATDELFAYLSWPEVDPGRVLRVARKMAAAGSFSSYSERLARVLTERHLTSNPAAVPIYEIWSRELEKGVWNATTAIKTLGAVGPDTLASLAPALASGNPGTRAAAYQVIEMFPVKNEATRAQLRQALADPNLPLSVLSVVCAAVGSLGEEGAEFIPALGSRLADDESQVPAAGVAMAKIGPYHEEALEFLIAAASRIQRNNAAGIFGGLAELGRFAPESAMKILRTSFEQIRGATELETLQAAHALGVAAPEVRREAADLLSANIVDRRINDLAVESTRWIGDFPTEAKVYRKQIEALTRVDDGWNGAALRRSAKNTLEKIDRFAD